MSFQDIPLEEILFFHVERMMKKAKDTTVATFKREGIDITKDQWVILKAISEQAGMTQVELSAHTYKDPASIKRSLDILLEKGYIDKKTSPTDAKALLHISESKRDESGKKDSSSYSKYPVKGV